MKRESLTIIGTAHVSSQSAEEVKEAIINQHPEVVAIELDFGRYTRLMQEKEGIVEDEEISVTNIIKENKVGVFVATSVLSYIQNKIGEDLDVKPGSEMIAAIETVESINKQIKEEEEKTLENKENIPIYEEKSVENEKKSVENEKKSVENEEKSVENKEKSLETEITEFKKPIKIALIDRDINITFQRALNKMSLWEKLKFVFSSIYALIAGDEEIGDIEELKNESNIAEVMEYFKDISPKAYQVLVKERDAYLTKKILEIPEDKIIAVVGAGHKEGINNYLDNPQTLPSFSELEDLTNKGIPWLKIILLLIPISFVVIFFLAFFNGINITDNLVEYILIGGICGFIGSIVSGSKIQSALVAFIVTPLTIIHPLLAAGWFSGLTESKFRTVKRSDINNLGKIHSLKDLWNNNIFRIFLVVIGTNLGVSIATLIILPSRVFFPLFLKIFGG